MGIERWGVGRGKRRPVIALRVVGPAGVVVGREAIVPAPDDHPGSGPHGGVLEAWRGRVRGAGGTPCIGNRIVATARVAGSRVTSPDDHPVAGPDGRVTASGA